MMPESLYPLSSHSIYLKKEAMMQKSNVSHGKTNMDKMVRRRELPCIRRLMKLYRGRVARGAVPMSMKEKSDEEAKKGQIIGLEKRDRL
jgi:hypothetical protein